jgi:hypothetical protein
MSQVINDDECHKTEDDGVHNEVVNKARQALELQKIQADAEDFQHERDMKHLRDQAEKDLIVQTRDRVAKDENHKDQMREEELKTKMLNEVQQRENDTKRNTENVKDQVATDAKLNKENFAKRSIADTQRLEMEKDDAKKKKKNDDEEEAKAKKKQKERKEREAALQKEDDDVVSNVKKAKKKAKVAADGQEEIMDRMARQNGWDGKRNQRDGSPPERETYNSAGKYDQGYS